MTFFLVLTILVSISSHTLYMQWRDDVFRRGNGLVQKDVQRRARWLETNRWARWFAGRAI